MRKHLFDIFVSWHVLNCLLSPHFDHAIGLIVLVLSDSICESIRLYSFAKSIRKDSFWEKKRKFNSFFFHTSKHWFSGKSIVWISAVFKKNSDGPIQWSSIYPYSRYSNHCVGYYHIDALYTLHTVLNQIGSNGIEIISGESDSTNLHQSRRIKATLLSVGDAPIV